jgi:hypothetical protein
VVRVRVRVRDRLRVRVRVGSCLPPHSGCTKRQQIKTNIARPPGAAFHNSSRVRIRVRFRVRVRIRIRIKEDKQIIKTQTLRPKDPKASYQSPKTLRHRVGLKTQRWLYPNPNPNPNPDPNPNSNPNRAT